METRTIGGYVRADALTREAALEQAAKIARQQRPEAISVETPFSRKRRNRDSYDVLVIWTVPLVVS